MTEAETLLNENQRLQARLAELEAETREEQQRLQARIDELEARSQTADPLMTQSESLRETPPPPALRDVKIDLPPEFDGKTAEYAAFIGQCEFYFDNKPSIFLGNDKNKVSLVISRLRGRAATWAHTLRRAEPNNSMFTSWPLFYAELNSLYEDPYYMEQMRREYDALEQKGSARTFAAEFKALAMTLHKGDADKIHDFKRKLKSNVRTGLTIATITDFDTLVAKAIELDQALFEDAKARKKAEQSQKSGPPSSSTSHPQQPRNNPPPQGPRNRPPSQNPSSSKNSSSSISGPRPHLTAEEKNRREALHLCRFCGSNEHFKKDCPDLQAKLEREHKGSSRYPAPASTSNVNAPTAPAPSVAISHTISPSSSGKFNPQGQ